MLAERTYPLCMLGRWDEAQAASAELTPEQIDAGGVVLSLLQSGVEIHIQRGELDEARRVFSLFSRLEESTDVQERAVLSRRRARHCAARKAGSQEALADGETTIEVGRTLGIGCQAVKQGIVEAIEAAFALGESAKVEELLALDRERSPPAPGRRTSTRRRGVSAPGSAEDAAGYEAAAERFRELGMPFWLAVTLLEHGEWLRRGAGRGRAAARRGPRDLRAAGGATLARTAGGDASRAAARLAA